MRHAIAPAVRWLARLGYGARGLVYFIFGALTLQAALEVSEARGVRASLAVVTAYPGGRAMLAVMVVGLVAYAFWRAAQALLDTDSHGRSPRALCVRGALLVSAATHVSLAWAAMRLALAMGTGQGQTLQQGVARALGWPGGRALVVALGLVLVAAGLAHILKAWRAGFRRWFVASAAAMRWIDPVSRVGLVARGLLFVGVGGFVSYAGLAPDSSKAEDMAGVLAWTQHIPHGRVLLFVWAIGVILFGVYSLIEAFVRRVEVQTA